MEFKNLTFKDDEGISIDSMFLDAFERLGKTNYMKRVDFPLVGFAGRTIYPLGTVILPVVQARERRVSR